MDSKVQFKGELNIDATSELVQLLTSKGLSIDQKEHFINSDFDYQEVTAVFIPQKNDTCSEVNPEVWFNLLKTIFVFENDVKLKNRKLKVVGKLDIENFENNYQKIFK